MPDEGWRRFDSGDQRDIVEVIGLMRTIGVDIQEYEVKTARAGLPKDITSTISAFSNGSGGTIILGISERDGFVPVEGFDVKSMQDAIANVCREKMSPPVQPIVDPMVFEGHPILVVRIPEMRPMDKPCYIRASNKYSGSYIRTADGDRRLSTYEVDRLCDEHRQPLYDKELVEEATLSDLDGDLLEALLRRERRIHARNFAHLDTAQAIESLNIAGKDESGVTRPTMAGLMALGVHPQRYFPRLNIAFASYAGVDKASVSRHGQRFLDSQSIIGPIPYLIADSIAAIARNTRTGAVIDGAFREDVPDYPIVALREAIANALMHRDYSPESRGTPVQIDLYVDRLEITNPGGLYGTVTIESLGKGGLSSTRNQVLSNLLESTPYEDGLFVAENRGSGYQAIEASLASALMPPPEPRDSISTFSLRFGRRRLAPDELGMTVADGVESAILGMLQRQSSVSTHEIMQATGRAKSTVMRRINQLIENGVLEPIEPKGSTKQRYRMIG